MDNKKPYCLITGASNGIGRALAEECTSRGMNLFLVALPGSGLEELSAHLSEVNGNDVKCLPIDLTEIDAPQKVFNYAKEHSLNVNIIINNAGVGGYGEMDKQPVKEVNSMVMLNVRATTMLTYFFLPGLKKLPKAYILNVSSFAAFLPIAKKCIYSATKTYILFFSRALNAELKDTNVMVSSIHPSGVATNSRIKQTMKKAHAVAKITTVDASDVARYTIDGMLKGKKIIIPGFATRFFYVLGSLLPYGLVSRLVGRIFRKSE